jgi:hypothetical protein
MYSDSSILPDPAKASITLAKLQNPVKSSFDTTNDSLKEAHSSLNKYTKALDKVIYLDELGFNRKKSANKPV